MWPAATLSRFKPAWIFHTSRVKRVFCFSKSKLVPILGTQLAKTQRRAKHVFAFLFFSHVSIETCWLPRWHFQKAVAKHAKHLYSLCETSNCNSQRATVTPSWTGVFAKKTLNVEHVCQLKSNASSACQLGIQPVNSNN